MKFTSAASSSRACCYLLEDSGGALLIDAGLSISEIRNRLGIHKTGVEGCLISHSHLDHSKAAKELARSAIDIYSSAETFEKLEMRNHHRAKIAIPKEEFATRSFRVLPFDVIHDAEGSLGFVIAGATGTLLYLTDTPYAKYKFANLTHIAIECNHSREILKDRAAVGELGTMIAKRVVANHMSLETLTAFLRSLDLSKVVAIYLLHLSDTNSDERAFKIAVAEATGKPVYIMEK